MSLAPLRRVPPQCRWVEQRLGRDHSLAQRSPQACALSRLLVTVADAQGLRDSAAPSLGQRFSLPCPARSQARQALLTRGVGASQHPFSQVFALDAAPVAAEDAPVDLTAVCARLWEVWA